MSDGNNDEYRVGYGKPPREYQFKKGRCPNPNGRPRKRHVAVLPREIRRAILQVGHTPLQVPTPEGQRTLPAFQALMWSLLRKGLGGQISSARLFFQLHAAAMDENLRADPDLQMLERQEARANAERLHDTELGWINRNRLSSIKKLQGKKW